MAGQPGRSGGARPGAGRRPLREKYADAVNAAEELIAAALPDLTEAFIEVATESETVVETYKIAGLLTKKEVLENEHGEPQIGLNDQAITREVPLFPNLKPETLVLIGRKKTKTPPNVLALKVLLERIAGKPITPTEEPDIAIEEVLGVIAEMQAAIEANVRDVEAKKVLAATLRQLAERVSGEDRSGDEPGEGAGRSAVPAVAAAG